MNSDELRVHLSHLAADFILAFSKAHHVEHLWRAPLIGFADVNHPYIRNLPYIVTDTHLLPEDFMTDPTVIISYFVPFTEEVASTNIGAENNEASKEWSDAYAVTNNMMAELNVHLVTQLSEMGYRAAVPQNTGMVESLLKSRWSQRHIAYAAGLGTFGINNMLITASGCCGRYNSIVADLPLQPDSPMTAERCLYKSKGICKKCVQNCFTGALTVESFDRIKCYGACLRNLKLYGNDVCGKCDTDIPCAFAAPCA